MTVGTTCPRIEIVHNIMLLIEIGFLNIGKIIGPDSMGNLTGNATVHYTEITSQVKGGRGINMVMAIQTVFMTETHLEKIRTAQALTYRFTTDSVHWETISGGDSPPP